MGRKKVESLDKLKSYLWEACVSAHIEMKRAEGEAKTKFMHALTQCAGQYVKLYEIASFVNLSERLEDLKARDSKGQTQPEAYERERVQIEKDMKELEKQFHQ